MWFISIVIPCYERGGTGAKCLAIALDSIQKQTFNLYEVIVADQSKDDAIKNLVETHPLKDKINYLSNKEKLGNPSANLNFGISQSKGNIIKPLFQDDFFLQPTALQEIVHAFGRGKVHWVAVGSTSTSDYVDFAQKWYPKPLIKNTYNRLGNPSSIAYRSYINIAFDEKYKWLMDMSFYVRVQRKYGIPALIATIHIGTLVSKEQLTHLLDEPQNEGSR